MGKSRARRFVVSLGRLLNRLGADLEVCSHCGRLTRWDDDRLWGPYMLCPRCDRRTADAYTQDILMTYERRRTASRRRMARHREHRR